MRGGFISLVGAGPGAEGLITVRGMAALREADAIVYDALINPALLRHARPGARLIPVGKRGGVWGRYRSRLAEQNAINRLLVRLGRNGLRVVRLKGGDPFILGRGGEEGAALFQARVPFEVVPGVTAGIAGPAYAGIPVTHRGLSSSVTLITGRAAEDGPERGHTRVDWTGAARGAETLVVYMAAARMDGITDDLLRGGRPASSPAAVVEWATTPRQRTITGTLGTIADTARAAGIAAPALLVVGKVAGMRRVLNWYETQPLFGRRIVVTRAESPGGTLSEKLLRLGAEVIPCPTIRFARPRGDALKLAASRAGAYDWVIFTSARGVDAFFAELLRRGDVRDLGKARIAVIGPATAQRVRDHHLRVDLQPKEFVAEGLLGALSKRTDIRGARVLLARAEEARDVLPRGLARLGAKVTVAPAYRTLTASDGPEAAEMRRRLAAGEVDAVTFTSSSTVEGFVRLVGVRALRRARRVALVSIGPVTSAALRRHGLRVSAQARRYDMEGLVEVVVSVAGRKRGRWV